MEERIWILEDEELEWPVAKPGVRFFMGARGIIGMPQERYLRLVAVDGDDRRIVGEVGDLQGLVVIRSKEDALQFVRMFTSLDTHYLLPNFEYIEPREVDGDAGPGEYVSPGTTGLNVESVEVDQVGEDQYLIRRTLLKRPNTLLRVEEMVEGDGRYDVSIVEILDDDSSIMYPVYE